MQLFRSLMFHFRGRSTRVDEGKREPGAMRLKEAAYRLLDRHWLTVLYTGLALVLTAYAYVAMNRMP
jgi:hypothetical protein